MINEWMTNAYVGLFCSYPNNNWLIQSLLLTRYRKGVTLAGIIYVHPITTERMSGTPERTLQMFKNRFGKKYARDVVFLTTKWDDVTNMGEAENQETDLTGIYWNDIISGGATVGRFYIEAQSGPRSPWMIIDGMIQRYQAQEPPVAYKTRYVKAGNLRKDDIVIV